ncbi:acyl carrier protein [Micromonospora sp. NBC_01392]|uniref:acyl carrier protein n=1 Tax=Micromonospora sp. NBC_01392 TaxID=2903588 RepID=UPI003255BCFF
MSPSIDSIVRHEVAAVLGIDPTELAGDEPFVRTYKVDSLELTEMGVRLERSLGRRLPVQTLRDIVSVDDFVRVLTEHLREGRP